jgi:hypothetical protein
MRVALLMTIVVFLSSCGRSAREKELQRQLAEHDKRITALEEKVAKNSEPRVALPPHTYTFGSTPPPAVTPQVAQPAAHPAAAPASAAPSDVSIENDARLAIGAYCAKKWGSNWQMRDTCEKAENEAFDKLAEGNTFGIPPSAYRELHDACTQANVEMAAQLSCMQRGAETYQQSH